MEAWKNELYHYGILGMKWGVRRFQNPDGTRTAAGKARYSSGVGSFSRPDLLYSAHSRTKTRSSGAKNVKSVNVSQMSDEELKKNVQRKSLEKTYKKLNKDNRGQDAIALLNASSNAMNQSANAYKKARDIKESAKKSKEAKKNQNQVDISKMSNKELQEIVTRLNLEQQYSRLNPNYVKTGSDYVQDAMELAGSVIAVGATALSIALAIKMLKD